MPKTVLPIANGYYESDSLPISAQECTNFYPNIVQTQALNQETLFGTPGLEQVAMTSQLEVSRGAHEMNGVPYFVVGNTLYSMDSSNVLTTRGTIAGSGLVSMADNGAQMLILIPGGNGYIYTHASTTLTQITDGDLVHVH